MRGYTSFFVLLLCGLMTKVVVVHSLHTFIWNDSRLTSNQALQRHLQRYGTKSPLTSTRAFYPPSQTSLTLGFTSGSPAPFFPEEDKDDETKYESRKTESVSSSAPTEEERYDYADTNKSSARALWNALDEFGKSLKPQAIKMNAKAELVPISEKALRYRYMVLACLFYSAFIVYRGYRGFFVILPAVFRETFQKLEATIDTAPFDDDKEGNNKSRLISKLSSGKAVSKSEMSTKIALWRTRIIISVLTSIVVAAYVISGALRVLSRMILTLRKGTVSKSFAAAVEEQERNEKILYEKMFRQQGSNNKRGFFFSKFDRNNSSPVNE